MSRLPVVSEEIGITTSEELANESEGYIARAIQEIRGENPFLASFLFHFSLTGPDKHASQKAAYCGLLVYKMLKNQAEADDLKRSLKM